jgi:hypothetical protein
MQSHLRTMQIIAGALLLGDVVFLGVTLYIVLVQNGGQGLVPPTGPPFLSLASAVMLGVCATLAFVIPGVQTRSALQQILAGRGTTPGRASREHVTEGAKLLVVRQTTLIVRLALLNGAAYLGCIAYLQEAHPLGLCVVGIVLVLMLGVFPTDGRVRAWLGHQAQTLEEFRQQQGSATGR